MHSEPIQFWFSIGSTYTYLTVSRLPQVAARTGLSFEWRPFSVRAIMREQNNTAFTGNPIKAAYMWRDIERRANMYGLPLKVPAPYPLKDFDLANRVAILGAQEGWCIQYVRATYRRWFIEGLEAGSEPNLSQSIAEAGQDPVRVIELAKAATIEAAFHGATNEARRLHIFGSPTLVTRGEVFWGDDRVEDAINWHRDGKLS